MRDFFRKTGFGWREKDLAGKPTLVSHSSFDDVTLTSFPSGKASTFTHPELIFRRVRRFSKHMLLSLIKQGPELLFRVFGMCGKRDEELLRLHPCEKYHEVRTFTVLYLYC